MKIFVRLCFVICLLLAISVLAFSLISGYENCMHFLVQFNKQNQFSGKVFALITPEKFRVLLFLLLFWVIVLVVFLVRFSYFFTQIGLILKMILSALKNSFNLVLNSEVKYFFIIPLLTIIYCAIKLPIAYDEAWTYLNFTSKNFLASISYYPSPNNHIFHSIISNLTQVIPWLPVLFKLRLSAILVSLLIFIISYSLLLKHTTKTISVVVLSLCSMFFMSLYFGFMSRGYGLVVLFFVAGYYSILNIVKFGSEYKNWVVFCISSILGFYTMPSFLYPFLTLNIIVLVFRRHELKRLIFCNIIISITVVLLYLPIIIVNGLDSLVNNKYVAPIPRVEVLYALPAFLSAILTEITAINSRYVLAVLLASFILAIRNRSKQHIILYLVFLICPFVFLVIHSVIPFTRTFVYYGFIIAYLFVVPLGSLLDKLKKKYLYSSLILLQLLLLYNFYVHIIISEDYHIVSHRAIEKIKGNYSYLSDDPLFEAILRFELQTTGFDSTEVNYLNSVELSADSVFNYDYIIIENKYNKTKVKEAIIRTDYYSVYRRK